MGSAWARIHTWDGSKWEFSSDWYEANREVIQPMVMAASRRYAEQQNITPRTPEQCE
jgi:branched-chain amino acid transport system substrate-binding protein